jgi:hypothetical protein
MALRVDIATIAVAAAAAVFSGLTYFRPAIGLAATGTERTVAVPASGVPRGQRLCITQELESAQCNEGELVMFLPSRWGSEQFPVKFAGIYCDFRESIVLTNGGVACVYTKVRRDALAAESAPQRAVPKE